ncbi:MAG: glutamate--cysteine ligase [Candidatus Poseidoniaceae archaeon]|nr:glutamate--cysteine ligase [Candidatus Poseidoniaceae archaeon]
MTVLHDLTPHLEEKREQITEWMSKKRSEIPIPIYGSVDIRDAGWKIAVVDANHFPAGFNNISEEDKPPLAQLLRNHINREYNNCQWVHLYPESHTRNKGYVENISALKELLLLGGFDCTVGSLDFDDIGHLEGLSSPLKLDSVTTEMNGEDEVLLVNGLRPDLVLLNNDLTEGLITGLTNQVVSPPPTMGWHRRRKSQHYEVLKGYIEEISEILGIDSWHLMPEWFVSKDKCLEKESCRKRLASDVDEFLQTLRTKYESLGIERDPVVFVKNDRGTYGLGIMAVRNGHELLEMSNRKMKKLTYSKGGVDVENFLIQEGIPTSLFDDSDAPVEPVVYLIDGQASSWFYRINSKRSDIDNLNSPSATFESFSESGRRYGEHAYGWHALVAELSMLAMGQELLMYGEGE